MTDEEQKALCDFNRFMLGYKSNDYSRSLRVREVKVDFDTGRFAELLMSCPKNIIFDINIWRKDLWMWDSKCFWDYDRVVQLLFDKIELFRWIVNEVKYVDRNLSKKGQKTSFNNYPHMNLCTMWISPRKET